MRTKIQGIAKDNIAEAFKKMDSVLRPGAEVRKELYDLVSNSEELQDAALQFGWGFIDLIHEDFEGSPWFFDFVECWRILGDEVDGLELDLLSSRLEGMFRVQISRALKHSGIEDLDEFIDSVVSLCKEDGEIGVMDLSISRRGGMFSDLRSLNEEYSFKRNCVKADKHWRTYINKSTVGYASLQSQAYYNISEAVVRAGVSDYDHDQFVTALDVSVYRDVAFASAASNNYDLVRWVYSDADFANLSNEDNQVRKKMEEAWLSYAHNIENHRTVVKNFRHWNVEGKDLYLFEDGDNSTKTMTANEVEFCLRPLK